MSYTEVTIIVAGALNEVQIFPEEMNDECENFIETAKESLQRSENFDEDAEIYVLYHEHESGVEDCACIQYVTDHRPFWSNEEKK